MHSVRAFLSPDNPLGFGLSDFVELLAASLLAAFFLLRAAWRKPFEKLAAKTGWCMLVLAALPVLLRLALLPHNAEPVPAGADDFGYLLLADTLRHFRLANPPHALPQFFEQIFVLQQPTRSAMFPLGQGLVLAFGWMLFGHPWAGVLLSMGALSALCYWMLRAWTSPNWALAGGLLTAFQFGPLCYWMNCYWGGAVSACAGCLVFGALPRIFDRDQETVGKRRRNAALLGLGLGLQLLTRPYEFFLLLGGVGLFLGMEWGKRREWRRQVFALIPVTALVAGSAGVLMLLQNKQVTGKWSTLPVQLYRYRYGIPATFTWQANAVPHGALNSEQDLDYRTEVAVHGPDLDTPRAYWERLVFRARFYRFFLLAPLYLALLAFLTLLRQRRLIWALATIVLFSLGSNFFPYFYPHYIAAVTCLFVLASVAGLQRLNQLRIGGGWPQVGTLLLFFCALHFVFWYGVHALGTAKVSYALARYETWDYINQGDPQGRVAVDRRLEHAGGEHLVFVRYAPQHRFQEWIKNGADIDGAPVVWAHDLGATENEKLRRYYPKRMAWLLQPDAAPPKLTPYLAEPKLFEDVQ
ncbi:MAG TPA: hypothetical protein VK604_25285 [Bryobacteraceae bacterium]|nr:hypothetical protein [Bryobacteraceae bacterium]